jgi:hypothetical protein
MNINKTASVVLAIIAGATISTSMAFANCPTTGFTACGQWGLAGSVVSNSGCNITDPGIVPKTACTSDYVAQGGCTTTCPIDGLPPSTPPPGDPACYQSVSGVTGYINSGQVCLLGTCPDTPNVFSVTSGALCGNCAG